MTHRKIGIIRVLELGGCVKAGELNLSAAEQRAVQMLRLLANPARFRIITLLAERKECTAAQLAAAVGLAQSTLAEHLGGLRDAGLVQTSGEGAFRFYCLDPEAVDFLAAFLGGVAQQARAWEGLVVETRTAGGLEIRDATLDDAPAIARIYNQGIE